MTAFRLLKHFKDLLFVYIFVSKDVQDVFSVKISQNYTCVCANPIGFGSKTIF